MPKVGLVPKVGKSPVPVVQSNRPRSERFDTETSPPPTPIRATPAYLSGYLPRTFLEQLTPEGLDILSRELVNRTSGTSRTRRNRVDLNVSGGEWTTGMNAVHEAMHVLNRESGVSSNMRAPRGFRTPNQAMQFYLSAGNPVPWQLQGPRTLGRGNMAAPRFWFRGNRNDEVLATAAQIFASQNTPIGYMTGMGYTSQQVSALGRYFTSQALRDPRRTYQGGQ